MHIFEVGDLVKPSRATWGSEDNPDALGLIIETRRGPDAYMSRCEAKIIWNDILDEQPGWHPLCDIMQAEEQQ
jgi:hypothetical protein